MRQRLRKSKKKVREKHTPNINMEATSLRDLIDWMTDIHEPIFNNSSK